MNRRHVGDLVVEWDASELPHDPIEPALPLVLDPSAQRALDARAATAPADLRVHCTRVDAPLGLPVAEGTLPILLHGRNCCFTTADGLVVWDGSSQVHVVDAGRRIEARVHASSLARPDFQSVTVLMALMLALRHHGYFHFHAAAARWPDGNTWVIAGNAGAGKSTLALALFAAGADWLTDDVVLLREVADHVQVIGWARHARMTSRTREAFPALWAHSSRCAPNGPRQWKVDPRQAFPGRGLERAAPPFTLLFPRVAGDTAHAATRLERADAFGRAMHACAWVAAHRLVAREQQLALLARLVKDAPAFELEVSWSLLRAPIDAAHALRALIAAPTAS